MPGRLNHTWRNNNNALTTIEKKKSCYKRKWYKQIKFKESKQYEQEKRQKYHKHKKNIPRKMCQENNISKNT